MYEALDNFISVDTWHTRHGADERRFYEALKRIQSGSNGQVFPEEVGNSGRRETALILR
jgi:hypothetical protein